MDLITFKEAAKLLPADISVLLRGRHGIGKSFCVRQIAKEFNLPIVERHLAQLTEGDLIGLPNQDGVVTRFMPPKWLYDATQKPMFVFLDEFDRAIEPVRQAVMEFILGRSIQGTKIHEGCRIYAAINGGKHEAMYNVGALDPAISDRFWIADIEPSIEEWLAWGAEGNVIPEVTSFISVNAKHLETLSILQDAHTITPSRRSWTRLSDVLKENPSIIANMKKKGSLFLSICIGFVGASASSVFRDFLNNPDNYLHVSNVLNNFDTYKNKISNFQIAQFNLMINKIAENGKDPDAPAWTKNQAYNVSLFFQLLPSELKMTMWDKVTSGDSKIENGRLLSPHISDDLISLIP